MGRKGITSEQVAKIAVEMTERGENPTARAVREGLGTGSLETINKFLKKWREEKALLATTRNNLSEKIQGAILEEIAKQIQKSEKESATIQKDLEGIVKELSDERDGLEEKVNNLNEEIAKLKNDLASSQGKTEQSLEENIKLKEELDREKTNAEKSRIEAAKAILKFETNQQAVDTINSEKKELLQKLDSERKEFQKIIDEGRKSCENIKIEKAEISSQLSAEKSSLATLSSEIKELKEELKKVTKAAVDSDKRASICESHQDQLKKQLKEKDEIIKDLRARKK